MPPPKKNLAAEELEDIKRSLDFLTEEISDVKLQQKTILELVEEVKALRIQNAEKDRRLDYLENRVADLEQYTRMNDIIVTGLRIKPQSYAKVVTADNGGSPSTVGSVCWVICGNYWENWSDALLLGPFTVVVRVPLDLEWIHIGDSIVLEVLVAGMAAAVGPGSVGSEKQSLDQWPTCPQV
ncbi:hypothetical protein AAFF_G00054760 [Aldrovandia affinis]|uniref:Uncharacterized protein n=1 Tax=Aldrovandia affinis TaxID=143900 RepID=A0AAD7WEK4_9TELE|nr:hypothetical protein AAFF_G00054760 [Aldrovandia affinis]